MSIITPHESRRKSDVSVPAEVAPGRDARPSTAIEIRGVTKSFPVRRPWVATLRHPLRREWTSILQSVTFDVSSGELFGLLGPNGAGKTTLFRILSSMVLPDEGTAIVLGRDVLQNPRAIRAVLTAVPAEERSLNWRLSARENLNLFGRLHRLKGKDLRRRVDEMLAVVELEEAGDKMVGKFSSGMKQRLMIARALLGSPRILLLDEPTRALDPVGARRLREFMKTELVGKQGCTVVLATHNSEEALQLCDRVAVLDRGRVLAVGKAEALAREMLGDRYQVQTLQPRHPIWNELAIEGRLILGQERDSDEGWTILELIIPSGRDGAARLLRDLAVAEVPIARFQPIPANVADLIEHLIRGQARGGADG